jgi:hypothetical protein
MKPLPLTRRQGLALLAALPGLTTAAAAATAAPDTRFGSHGMAVFGGRQGLYASHLPMFHAPHDSQVVMRLHLADAAADRALRQAVATRPRLWTLDPEKFDLLRLAPGHAQPLRQFSARFFDGHFERGGRPRPGAQQVVVSEVLHFQRLSAAPREAATGRYQVLGRGAEWFAFKHIDRRPDCDHIVRLARRPALTEVDVALSGLARPDLAAALGVPVAAELYFETADLV